MSFFKKLFGGEETQSIDSVAAETAAGKKSSSAIKFGRYTDCNKTKEQVKYWNESLDKFKAKAYVDSFEAFLFYLRDTQTDNVRVNRNGDVVSFEIIQGSKVIRGTADKDKFAAEANLVTMESVSLPVMRKLMSLNYGLKYSKFALKDNVLCMKFSSHALDASPNKLYDALKELAKKADQQDDLLIAEFSSLKEIDTEEIIPLDEGLQEVRYNYMLQLVRDTEAEIAKLDADQMSGGIAFLLLNLSYTIDFLILPQGNLTDSLEKIQHMFFAKDDLSTKEKNKRIVEEFDKIMAWPKEEVLEGLYDIKATFAIARPESHKYVMDFFFKEREKVGWYRDNGYPKIVESIYSYMITYAFFNMGMIYPMSDLLNLCIHLINPDYYKSFGSKAQFLKADGSLNNSEITKEVNRIIANAKKDYPYIGLNTSGLRFNSVSSFIDSMIVEMDKLNLRKN
ncbi:MAG: YbjN domain-containing protein [Flavobacteriales bacterium]|nr:YbjN domain-containing protein [Flavobacteriales bacterium]